MFYNLWNSQVVDGGVTFAHNSNWGKNTDLVPQYIITKTILVPRVSPLTNNTLVVAILTTFSLHRQLIIFN